MWLDQNFMILRRWDQNMSKLLTVRIDWAFAIELFWVTGYYLAEASWKPVNSL
jgi:hypothetical protein